MALKSVAVGDDDRISADVEADPERHAQRLARKERRHAQRRHALLGAARALLVTRGFEQLTMNAVAAAADVSKPSVYYYFDSKEDLVAELAVEALRAEVAAIERAVRVACDGVEAIHAFIHAYVDHYGADPESFRLLYVWPQVAGARAAAEVNQAHVLQERVAQGIARKLARDRDSGRLKHDLDTKRLIGAARVAAHGLASLLCHGASREDVSALREELATALTAKARA